jgi:hypothetical protein
VFGKDCPLAKISFPYKKTGFPIIWDTGFSSRGRKQSLGRRL